MAKLTGKQREKAQSIKALRGAQRRIKQREMATKQKTPAKRKAPSVTERTKGITNIIKKRASQPERVFKGKL